MGQLRQFVKFRKQDFDLMQHYYPNISFFKKVVYCWKKYQYQKKYNFAHMEFFCLHLGEKTKDEVSNFYPRKLQAGLYDRINEKRLWPITKDKFASYQILKDFYKRQACAYNPSPCPDVQPYYENYTWESEILSFLKTHTEYIIKPLAEACGRGVKIVKSITGFNAEDLLHQYIDDYPKGFVIEELIHQHDTLSIFHPSSVNTIRVNVFNSTSYAGGIEVLFPCFRVGRHGSVVDNAGSGGIIVALDAKTGRMISAADEDGKFYHEHPDSHIPFNGEIPFWGELLKMAVDVSEKMPGLRIAGLDFALDKEKGWSLVEINFDPYMLYEIATQKGIRNYIEDFAQKCGVQLT